MVDLEAVMLLDKERPLESGTNDTSGVRCFRG